MGLNSLSSRRHTQCPLLPTLILHVPLSSLQSAHHLYAFTNSVVHLQHLRLLPFPLHSVSYSHYTNLHVHVQCCTFRFCPLRSVFLLWTKIFTTTCRTLCSTSVEPPGRLSSTVRIPMMVVGSGGRQCGNVSNIHVLNNTKCKSQNCQDHSQRQV